MEEIGESFPNKTSLNRKERERETPLTKQMQTNPFSPIRFALFSTKGTNPTKNISIIMSHYAEFEHSDWLLDFQPIGALKF